mmetsp:Transcript_40115/g.159526  ORF Transcript_40115/g.159526 Transcript_40115/m.159526 type:complete len:379 (-) Transcript_40115:648-1784(-)
MGVLDGKVYGDFGRLGAGARGARSGDGLARRAKGLVKCYLRLGKHKLSALVTYTGAVGFVMGSAYSSDGLVDYEMLGWTSVGTALCAASANCLNQLYEIKRDAVMSRTNARPLPAGRVSKLHALGFAAVTGILGYGILDRKTDRTTASLGLANIALYAGVYTPLKVIHPINTWVGAVVGAIPPLMGWSAANAGDLSHTNAWLLGGALFVWQIPHFHALAALYAKDYTKGGYKMLAQSNPKLNARLGAWMAYTLLPLGPLAVHSHMTSPVFAVEALGLNLWMIRSAEKMLENPTSTVAARSCFRASITYLPLVLAALMIHKKTPKDVQPHEGEAKLTSSRPPAYTTVFASFPLLPCPSFLMQTSEEEGSGTETTTELEK